MRRFIAFKAIRVGLIYLGEVLSFRLWAVVGRHARGVKAGLLLKVVVVRASRLLRVESTF